MKFPAFGLRVGLALLLASIAAAAQAQDLRQRVDSALAGFECAKLIPEFEGGSNLSVVGRVSKAEDVRRLMDAMMQINGLGQVQIDVDTVAWPFCAALDVLAQPQQDNINANYELRMIPTDRSTTFSEGESLRLTVRPPSFASFIYIDYFLLDGTVAHILPNNIEKDNAREAKDTFKIGEKDLGQREWIVSPPFGTEMISVIASSEPLFNPARNEIDSTNDYLPALQEAIQRVRGNGQVRAEAIFVTTQSKQQAMAGDDVATGAQEPAESADSQGEAAQDGGADSEAQRVLMAAMALEAARQESSRVQAEKAAEEKAARLAAEKAAEEEAARLAAEKAAEEEAARLAAEKAAEEEAARLAAEKAAEEEAARLAAEKAAEEEAARLAAEKAAEEEAARLAAEKAAEEEAARLAAEKAAEEEAARLAAEKAAEEEAARLAAEKAAEEEAARLAAEKAAEEEAARLAAEKAAEEEAARLAAEKAAEEEAARLAAEKAAEEEAARLAAEKAAEEEAARLAAEKAAAEEAARLAAEKAAAEEAARLAAEKAAAEEAARLAAEKAAAEEAARLAAEKAAEEEAAQLAALQAKEAEAEQLRLAMEKQEAEELAREEEAARQAAESQETQMAANTTEETPSVSAAADDPSIQIAALSDGEQIFLPREQTGYNQGPRSCRSCHRAEFAVWEGTDHFSSFRQLHKLPKSKEILAALGDAKNARKSELCANCHYTLIQKNEGDKPRARQGPSCESCHGPSSGWLEAHYDYGGPNVQKEDETPEHKEQRMATIFQNGMIWPSRDDMRFDVAMSCMECHGLNHPELDGETLERLLAAGHPIDVDYELVRYSQGSIRHRFYEPNVTVNAELSVAESARLFVEGQAAKLISAVDALRKASGPEYRKAQERRARAAISALNAVKNLPEVIALLQRPTEENARKLVDAISDTDLSPQLQALLPARESYK